tara:strand:+ start:6369 stop:6671 length:303 start_codon:yes stop_codon:yes gene_type:complete
MNLNKGDLVLVKSLDDTNMTCIIVAVFIDNKYYYCYCVEDGLYNLIYKNEIQCRLAEDFAPDFPESDLFDIDYSFYAACFDAYSYFPSYMSEDDDDTEEK